MSGDGTDPGKTAKHTEVPKTTDGKTDHSDTPPLVNQGAQGHKDHREVAKTDAQQTAADHEKHVKSGNLPPVQTHDSAPEGPAVKQVNQTFKPAEDAMKQAEKPSAGLVGSWRKVEPVALVEGIAFAGINMAIGTAKSIALFNAAASDEYDKNKGKINPLQAYGNVIGKGVSEFAKPLAATWDLATKPQIDQAKANAELAKQGIHLDQKHLQKLGGLPGTQPVYTDLPGLAKSSVETGVVLGQKVSDWYNKTSNAEKFKQIGGVLSPFVIGYGMGKIIPGKGAAAAGTEASEVGAASKVAHPEIPKAEVQRPEGTKAPDWAKRNDAKPHTPAATIEKPADTHAKQAHKDPAHQEIVRGQVAQQPELKVEPSPTKVTIKVQVEVQGQHKVGEGQQSRAGDAKQQTATDAAAVQVAKPVESGAATKSEGETKASPRQGSENTGTQPGDADKGREITTAGKDEAKTDRDGAVQATVLSEKQIKITLKSGDVVDAVKTELSDGSVQEKYHNTRRNWDVTKTTSPDGIKTVETVDSKGAHCKTTFHPDGYVEYDYDVPATQLPASKHQEGPVKEFPEKSPSSVPNVDDAGVWLKEQGLVRWNKIKGSYTQNGGNCAEIARRLAEKYGYEIPTDCKSLAKMVREYEKRKYDPYNKHRVEIHSDEDTYLILRRPPEGSGRPGHMTFYKKGQEYNYGATKESGQGIKFRIPLKKVHRPDVPTRFDDD